MIPKNIERYPETKKAIAQNIKSTLVPKRHFKNPIYKDEIRILKSCEETGGTYSLGELTVFPGGGNGLHTHSAFQETFIAVEGALGVRVSDEKHILQPGESVTVPKGTPHHFYNPGNEAITCHIKFVPGHAGFEKGLAIGYGLATDGKTNSKGVPKSLKHLALLVVLTDTKPTGIFGYLFPLFKWLAKKAKKNGMEDALLEQYYYA